MKKLVVAVMSIAVAAVVNAASVNWGGAIATVDGSDTLGAGTTAYLLYSDSAMAAATALSGAAAVGVTADNGGTIVDAYSLSADDLLGWAFSSTYTKTGSDVNGFYAILVQDATQSDKLSYMDMGSITGTTATSAASELQFNTDWSSDAVLTQNGWTVAAGAVPEPTSGLLILLGMAGLALKRKQA